MSDHSDYAAVDFAPKQKMYVLVEFPYPSGAGLHVGHAFSFVGGDVYARFQRMQGKNVLFPIGWDAFGLPTENYAIRTGRSPQDVTRENTETFTRQFKSLGMSYDWPRLVNSTSPDYYRWTQWIFTRLFDHHLAYKQEIPINWCPSCKVGLANEEVVNGKCERCGAETTRRRVSQWVVKITAYADRLIEGLKRTEFIEKVKAAQINWIGRSPGARIRFSVQGMSEVVEVFTTRPDTLWGCTFLVLAPEHPLVETVLANEEIRHYVENSRKKSDLERADLVQEKSGIFSGRMAIHPGTGQEIPIWISDFVLPTYGSGAIMAVPAHDDRDFAFAQKYQLPIIPVVLPEGEAWDFSGRAYTGMEGVVQNSGPISGMKAREAIPAVIQWLEEYGWGQEAVSYHLRDWIFSRQHYWGEPIPMIHCSHCGWVRVPDEDLPVLLPEVEKYQPTETGESPLANIQEWVNVTCPNCAGPAQRETDTMPNWAGSDWYFLRYCDPQNSRELASLEKMRYWMPVDVYIGGDEHNTLHLLYSRFIYLFLHDLGVVPEEIPEPYQKRLSHGVILGPDGQRMSKSHGNVISTDDAVGKYGADVVRTYLMFMGPFDATMAWNMRSVLGVKRFLQRFRQFIEGQLARHTGHSSQRVTILTNRLAHEVAEDLSAFKFNTAVAKIMEGLNTITGWDDRVAVVELRQWVQILSPLAPFLGSECWELLEGKGSVHLSIWPAYHPELDETQMVVISVQVDGKLRGTLEVRRDAEESDVIAQASQLESAARQLQGKMIQRVVYKPGRTLNFVLTDP